MPWKERTPEMLRYEFVQQVEQSGITISELCRRYSISRRVGYKWIKRYRTEGIEGLCNRSKQRVTQPHKTPEEMEGLILRARELHPCWGGRKLKRYLENQGTVSVPCASTVTEILRRHNKLPEERAATLPGCHRFEHEAPNHLWQMDFKGHFPMERPKRCHPLTILDDHSRFSIGLYACTEETHDTVKSLLIQVFRRYGLPERINTDNGAPWGSCGQEVRYTALSVWLMELGIRISYSRPFHPQTNGKDERFHRTLNEEVIKRHYFSDKEQVQAHFDLWRHSYNYERPHEALGFKVPAQCYIPSYRSYPETLQPFEYRKEATILKVDQRGRIVFNKHTYFLGMGFSGRYVALEPTTHQHLYALYFCHQQIANINLEENTLSYHRKYVNHK